MSNGLQLSEKSLDSRSLPLKVFTPEVWVELVSKDIIGLLNEHAHLERKAGSNALSLVHRWPDQIKDNVEAISDWTDTLTEIALDEVNHLNLVLELLEKRKARFEKYHSSLYVSGLREKLGKSNSTDELVDKLLLSSIVEARSCERFLLLAQHVEDRELAKVYLGLWSSEHRHYEVFLKLAYYILPKESVDKRFDELLSFEADLIKGLDNHIGLHSWIS